jgi:DNA-binding response OmpR family regulator
VYQVENLTKLKIGDLCLDLAGQAIERNGFYMILSKKEFALLEHLMKNCKKTLSREYLMNNIWYNSLSTYSNTVDVHINGLRKKLTKYLGVNPIKTVHGRGYKFDY